MVLSIGGRPYKCLFYLTLAYIVIEMVSEITAGKIILLFGYSVSVSVLYFPLTFVIADVLTEVYGYAIARRVLWIVLAVSVVTTLIYKGVTVMPSPAFFTGAAAYERVFGIVPQIFLGGWIAVFAGESANNYVMAKLKVYTDGRYLWVRTIGSTVVGQGINTLLFYVIALYGSIPWAAMTQAILAGWLFKVLVEIICTPIVYKVVSHLKKIEHEDHFDRGTNFNPFRY